MGSVIWELCDGENTIADLVNRVMQKFDVKRSVALADVEEFVQELIKEGMLELKE